ncbi:cytochrome P450 family protein [Parasponia andersonii]|uniref:Cytochrome P450 family protein n=1 Tax=Parasponia andersonii TaxID=3476 RepID=A0A2P5E3Q9_PARAD|nr:cytochrome P450 family protein [Parasponia andersonii]
MKEKGVNWSSSNPCLPWSSPLLQWRFGLLTTLVLVSMVVVWSIDGCNIRSFLEAWRSNQDFLTMKVSSTGRANLTHINGGFRLNSSSIVINQTQNETNSTQLSSNFNIDNPLNFTQFEPLSSMNSSYMSTESEPSQTRPVASVPASLSWVEAELEPNVTTNLLARWLSPGGEPCRDSRTVEIAVPGLDGEDLVELPAGEIHEFGFQALDEAKNPRCLGGDYFETDLSGDSWKSRPLVRDFGNGSYSVSLQVHPDFVGTYNLTIILLFRHFEGLKFSPSRFAYDRELRKIRIRFSKSSAQLPELQLCQESDFGRDIWAGRWTRQGKNDACKVGNDGRYRCLAADFPCQNQWCDGSLGSLESNGWVYSTHCSFRLFSSDSAWNCWKNRWIFFWGDSNHVDTIRNILNFILDLPEIKSVPRRFDMNFSNPKDPSQTVRITSIFNGHWNETQNYQGLNSLKDEGFRNLVKKYFSEDTVPDTVIMNSGLHDGIFWSTIRAYSKGAYYAASFWADILESVRQRGLKVPKVFYRTTVATGGYARSLGFNPSKMEAFNWVLLEKLRQAGVISGVIDNFDMTFPWHFDNRCNDGVHYGRAPAKLKWRDGQIGHQYFVDLMLAHVLLNALCLR